MMPVSYILYLNLLVNSIVNHIWILSCSGFHNSSSAPCCVVVLSTCSMFQWKLGNVTLFSTILEASLLSFILKPFIYPCFIHNLSLFSPLGNTNQKQSCVRQLIPKVLMTCIKYCILKGSWKCNFHRNLQTYDQCRLLWPILLMN